MTEEQLKADRAKYVELLFSRKEQKAAMEAQLAELERSIEQIYGALVYIDQALQPTVTPPPAVSPT